MKASEINYLVDAGPIVGLFSVNDQWHEWSDGVFTSLAEPVATTETVWAEVCHLLGRDRPSLFEAIAALHAGHILLVPVWQSGARIVSLLEKYPLMDVGDASLVVLSEKIPRAKIITTDVRDFTVYRRFLREPLPLIHP